MKYTTVHFPRDLLVSQGLASDPANTWMLVRRWRVLARRVLLLAVPFTLLYTTAAFLLVLLPLVRISTLRSSTYVIICLEQVAWVVALAVLLYVYTKRRSWLPGAVALMAVLLLIKGTALISFHLDTIWCARPNFGNEFVFTVPFDVPCQGGICTLRVLPEEQPPLCAIMHQFFHEMGPSNKPRVVADVLLGQHVIQILLGLIIIVHALEDQIRLGY